MKKIIKKSPQLEDGYIRISTELWEALTYVRIPGVANQCLRLIIRKTYGWGKREDYIALSQFVLSLKIKKPNVIKALNTLTYMNIIIKKDTPKGNIYRINKDYSSWRPLSKRIRGVSKKIIRGIKKDNPWVSKKIPTINTITIDTNNIYKRFTPPLLTEVKEYAATAGLKIDCYRFIDFYESKGWMVGKNKMKDWKAAVRNWVRNNNDNKPNQGRVNYV